MGFMFGALCPSKSGLMKKHIVKHIVGGVRRARETVGKKRTCDCMSSAAWWMRSTESYNKPRCVYGRTGKPGVPRCKEQSPLHLHQGLCSLHKTRR